MSDDNPNPQEAATYLDGGTPDLSAQEATTFLDDADGAEGSGTAATVLDGVPTEAVPTYFSRRLPPPLAERYQQLGLLGSGSEADVYRCRELATGEEVAIKLYRARGARLTAEAMAILEQADPAHVAPVSFGRWQDEHWEVQEYFPLETLAKVAAERGPLDEKLAREVLAELAEAIAYTHTLRLAHRDIKPSNVLVRSLTPVDVVLGDFGLTREMLAARQTGSLSRTPGYAPPEAVAHGDQSTAGDWWALGISMYELLLGKHIFSDPQGRMLSEATIFARLASEEVDLTALGDDRWKLLLRGLLTKDPTQRWGHDQVREWLGGGSPTVYEPKVAPVAPVTPGFEFRFAGFGFQVYESTAELGAALAADWETSAQFLSGRGGSSLQNALDHTPLGPAVRALFAAGESGTASIDGVLFELIALLAPEQSPVFRGLPLTGETLATVAARAQQGDADAADWVRSLRMNHVLEHTSHLPEYAGFVAIDQKLSAWWNFRTQLIEQLVEAQRVSVDAGRVERSAAADLQQISETQRPHTEGDLLACAFDEATAQKLHERARDAAVAAKGGLDWADQLGHDVATEEPSPPRDLLFLQTQELAAAHVKQREDRLRNEKRAARRAVAGGRIRRDQKALMYGTTACVTVLVPWLLGAFALRQPLGRELWPAVDNPGQPELERFFVADWTIGCAVIALLVGIFLVIRRWTARTPYVVIGFLLILSAVFVMRPYSDKTWAATEATMLKEVQSKPYPFADKFFTCGKSAVAFRSASGRVNYNVWLSQNSGATHDSCDRLDFFRGWKRGEAVQLSQDNLTRGNFMKSVTIPPGRPFGKSFAIITLNDGTKLRYRLAKHVDRP